MKLFNAVVFSFLSFSPLVANSSEQLSSKQITAILNDKTAEIKVIGSLKFCKKNGLAQTLLTKVTSTVINSFISAKETNTVAKLEQVVQAIDIHTVGIATGLSLASMPQASNEHFCSVMVEVADDMLIKQFRPDGT